MYFYLIFRITVVYIINSTENKITNLKSCQKRIANSDESLSCSDCMCIATNGFSSNEFIDVIENQRKDRQKYEEMEKENKAFQIQVSNFQEQVAELEKTLSEYKTKYNDDHVTELFRKNWEKEKDIFTKETEKKERTLIYSLNKVKEDVEENSENVLSQIKYQSQEINELKGTGICF